MELMLVTTNWVWKCHSQEYRSEHAGCSIHPKQSLVGKESADSRANGKAEIYRETVKRIRTCAVFRQAVMRYGCSIGGTECFPDHSNREHASSDLRKSLHPAQNNKQNAIKK